MRLSDLVALVDRLPFLAALYDLEIVKRLHRRFLAPRVRDPHYYVELVNRCNVECVFCPYVAIRDSGKEMTDMSDEHFERSVALIRSSERSSVSMTPTTGEVFMSPSWDRHFQTILDLSFVKDVYLYTNAVLLNPQNRAKLLGLGNLHKLSLSLSTGGVDRGTYKHLFGKDKFDLVAANINALLGELKQSSLALPVIIDIKLPREHNFSRALAKRTYNACGYKHLILKVRHEFDLLQGLITDERLKAAPSPPAVEKSRPCGSLNDIRFAADGSIWLCGCVISELPGSEDLRVGELGQHRDLDEIARRQGEIQRQWLAGERVPYNCRECSWYSPDRHPGVTTGPA
jgi:hypothetical protein